MSFLWFIIIGAVAGWLASLLMKGSGLGFVGNLLTGICGGILGGWLAGELKINVHLSDNELVNKLTIAVAGSIILLFFLNMWKKKR